MGGGVFTIGEVPAGAPVTPIYDFEVLEKVQIGDVISPLGDYLLVWDEDCLPPSKLEPWRRLGDPLSDEVVRALGLQAGQDGLQRILDHLELPESEQLDCVQRFWTEIARDPPPGLSALPDSPSAGSYNPRSAFDSSNFAPPPILAEGQAIFWRYSVQIFSALLHFSLAGGFSANRVMNVLRETNYLTGDARDKTYRRLLETTQAIMDYMNDMTPITGIGWKSAIRVRLLHSSVRVRLANKLGMMKTYDEDVDGIPINQEDLIATLGSFAIAPLWSLRRMGFRLSPQEEQAYVATWRHIGYYLGISPEKLEHHYATVSRAEKLFASNIMHLFSTDYITDDYRTTHTYRLLASVANRPPRYASVETSLALSRFLLGDGLANRLALPPTGRWEKLKMHTSFMVERWMKAFGRVYRHGWEVERVGMTRMLVLMIVCWQLGERRTKFTIKEFADDMEKLDVQDEKGNLVKTEKKFNPDDDELDPEVRMGPAAGKAIVARWKWMLAEMGAVVAGVGLGVSGVAYLGFRRYIA